MLTAERSSVILKVYDVTGKLVKRLMEGRKRPGYYKVEWDGRNDGGEKISSGVYFYSLTVEKKTGPARRTISKKQSQKKK